jgi:hypothetical protein
MDRIDAMVAQESFDTASELAHVLDELAVRVLQGVGEGREAAPDLLAADALLTYAMEAAAEDPQAFEAFAAASAERVATLASRGGQP